MRQPWRARVLFVIQTYPDGGGISSILENYIDALGNRYEVHVAIVDQRSGRAERLPIPDERVHVLGYTNLINPLLFPMSVAYTATVAVRLSQVVKRISPALVVAKDGLNLPVPTLLATARRAVPVAIVDHGTLTNVHEPGFIAMVASRLPWPKRVVFRAGFIADTPWRAARWRLGVRFARHVWFTGEELKPWFLRAGSRAHEYTQTVPTDFEPPTETERRAARKEFAVDDDERVFNVVGRLDGEKGLDTILEALSGLARRSPRFKVFVAGDGSLATWFRAETDRRGLSTIVRFLGRLDREQVSRLQQASDFHLYAGTVSCGVSICLLEAMASGVVPIASDVPAAQRPIVGSAGWVFRAGDSDELRQMVRAALDLPADQVARLRKASRERVMETPHPTVPELIANAVGDAGQILSVSDSVVAS